MRALSRAEELCLLMLDGASGSLCSLPGQTRDFGLAAAVLLELAQHDRINTEPDSLSVVDASPIGDDVADEVLAEIASSEQTRSPEYWVRRIGLQSGSQMADSALDRLAGLGILERLPGGLFFLAPEVALSQRYPGSDGRGANEVRGRVVRMLFSGEVSDPRDADLIRLADACGVFELVLSTAEFDKVQGQIEKLKLDNLLCRIARQVVDDDLTAQAPARREFKPIPEVPGLPIIGNALGMTGDLQAYLDELYKRHGPIFSLRAPGRRIVVMAGREANAFMMEHSQTHLRSNRQFAGFSEALEADRVVVSMDGHDHIKLRRLLWASYSRVRVGDNLPAVIDIARRAVASWPAGRPLPVFRAMQEIAPTQLGTLLTGLNPSEFVDDLLYWFDSCIISMRKDRPKFMCEYRLRKVRPRIRELFQRIMELHDPARQGTSPPRDLIDEVLDIHRRDPQFLPEIDLTAAVVVSIIPALGSVPNPLGLTMLRLLAEPRWVELLQHEADEAFAAGLADADGIHGLEMTRAFLTEVMRFHPPDPALPRTACNSFEFQGHEVPAGTSLWMALAAVHKDPDYYPDPERFDPERHLPPRLESSQPGAYVPFGLGPHRCLGAEIAKDLMTVTLATLLHCAEFARYPLGDNRLKIITYPSPRPHPKCRIQVKRHRLPPVLG